MGGNQEMSRVSAVTPHPVGIETRAEAEVEVELFGVPRMLAGRRSLLVAGGTLGEVAASLRSVCPVLGGRVLDAESGWLLGGYTFVVDERFTRDASCPLTPEASVLLVSSVAGG